MVLMLILPNSCAPANPVATPDEIVVSTTTDEVTNEATSTVSVETKVEETLVIVEDSSQAGYLTSVTEPVVEFVPSPSNDDYEYDLLARCIYQEAGSCGEYCQWLVGSTVLNLADYRGCGIEIVFDYDTFNVAYELYDETPSDLSYAVAARVLSGDRDYDVMAFRTDYYHPFGAPYTNVDNVYFSTF